MVAARDIAARTFCIVIALWLSALLLHPVLSPAPVLSTTLDAAFEFGGFERGLFACYLVIVAFWGQRFTVES